jgi:hypothetical protein
MAGGPSYAPPGGIRGPGILEMTTAWSGAHLGGASPPGAVHSMEPSMRPILPLRPLPAVLSLVLVLCSFGSSASAQAVKVPPPIIVGQWKEDTFLPERQCHGHYAAADLQQYLTQARVAMWLPDTRSVNLDPSGECITIRVQSLGGARLAELVLRGVNVPRQSVLLLWERPQRQG